ncbi:uncharacterized protein TRIADDRAFT_50363 [Trichoplax adhaerens]|uniref:Serpin domain-containing protein n=1 Tax=Trichoplax adhaerens TaxID=10228 RepID=B3S0N6_TRIAD|nr:hypothetical protein TRIADDRAFT_50363 [Trichoplax adhaerens]EDV23672.1 hypothetical protein TRIADDRAFT_50363 [Trichoplax adhaerens]|eukprot:XP_002113198.1 hypothetical protein TRIADDRAFT_50363 [Trichoplax adhaerens]
MELYREIGHEDQNSIFSSYSLIVAMSMVLAGCRGNTAKQVVQALHFDHLEVLDIHTSMRLLSHQVQQHANNVTCQFNDANCIFTQKGFPILPFYLKLVRDFYHSDVKEVDFSDSQSTTNLINQWIDKMTNHKISQLFDPADITPMTKLVLANAIYFKGKWKLPFDKLKVTEKPFHYTSNEDVIVKMMSRKMKVNYMQDHSSGIQMIELPYECSKTSMIIVLPQSVSMFSDLKQILLMEGKLDQWINSMRKMEVNVQIPKFSIKQRMNLNGVLKKLGMTDLFDSSRADLTGISQAENLFVGKVIQEARLDVNEEGSEAAAATGVIVLAKMMLVTPEFIADRPFIYLIRDVESNTILFMGHVRKP